MTDTRNKPCMSHYPDFDHHCASKGQGCEYYMKTFKVYTKWIGYSEIIVDAKDEQEAREFVDMGSYDPDEEQQTGNGLDYGFEDEEILKVKEVS